MKKLQNEKELAWFIEKLKRESVKSYLEIGSKFGGSLWEIARALPTGSRIVSIDLPHGDASLPHLQETTRALSALGYDVHLILGSSIDRDVIEKARKLGPYDAIFIDANHTLPFVMADWSNYGPMGKLVAFHDINFKRDKPNPKSLPIEVPVLWNTLKQSHRHEEIKLDAHDNGIGIVWHH